MGETRAESAKRRRIAGDSQYGLQGLINGTIVEEDLTMTEGLSEDCARTKDTLESLGDRRKATLVNRDIPYGERDIGHLLTILQESLLQGEPQWFPWAGKVRTHSTEAICCRSKSPLGMFTS